MRISRAISAHYELRKLRDERLRKDPLPVLPDVRTSIWRVGNSANLSQGVSGVSRWWNGRQCAPSGDSSEHPASRGGM